MRKTVRGGKLMGCIKKNGHRLIRRPLILLLFIFILNSIACSTILKRESLQAQTGNTGWIKYEKGKYEKGYKFQVADVSIAVHDILLTDSAFLGWRCLWIGPPLFPIIPSFRNWSNLPRKIGFQIRIDGPNDSAMLDFYKVQIVTSDGRLIRPVAVFTQEENGTSYDIHVDRAYTRYRGRLLEPGKVTLPSGDMYYNLQFIEFPTDVKEVTVYLGTIQISGKDFEIPSLKFRKMTKYKYYWINDV